MKRLNAGFTLVEIVVVVSIIAILAAVIYANFGQAGAQSRDAKRKADLRTMQSAIELYKNENGRYPEGCNGPMVWSGEANTNFACSSGNQYIVGLAPKYIPVLPKDPKTGSGDYGYVYLTNDEGTVYKLVARKSVESEQLNYDSDFKACDVIEDVDNVDGDGNSMTVDCSLTDIPQEGSWCGLGSCNIYFNNPGYSRPASGCNIAGIKNSFAVWGGYADPAYVSGAVNDDIKVERGTEQVICKMP